MISSLLLAISFDPWAFGAFPVAQYFLGRDRQAAWLACTLGPVDGFDQDESASESDESTVTDCSFLAAHGDPLEAFQLADRLFDPGAGLVE